ncbi:MAG: hypothetical protein AB7T74_00940 [Clostridia bacterium]|jgi:hypothetical protein
MMISIPASQLPQNSLPRRDILKNSRPGRTLLLFLAPLVLASCATRLRIPAELEAERLLPEGALAYLRVDPAMTGELILPLIDSYGASRYGLSQTEDLLARTESIVLAVMPPADDSGILPGKSVVFGVVSGNFPTRSIALKLSTDRQWSREGPGWVHKEEDFHLALTSERKIIAGTAPLATITGTGYEKPHPVPEFWRTAWYNDLAAYIPDPQSLMTNALPMDISGLPLESMLVSARRVGDQYELFLGFGFDTERSAVVFAPLCRLFLYGLARSLWPQESTGILAAVTWSTQGSTVEASGLRLDASQMASLLALPSGQAMQAPTGQMDGSK